MRIRPLTGWSINTYLKVLNCFLVGDFVRWIKLLYHESGASVMTNYMESKQLSLATDIHLKYLIYVRFDETCLFLSCVCVM